MQLNLKRILNLYVHSWHERKNSFPIVIGAAALITLIITYCIVAATTDGFEEMEKFNPEAYTSALITCMAILGVLYSAASFPGFRSKEGTLDYLMTPASRLEKLLVEFLNRVVLFVLVFPLFYWVVVNVFGFLVSLLNPDFINYGYNPAHALQVIEGWEDSSEWGLNFILLYLSFNLSFFFVGSTFFQKYPLIKTLLWTGGIISCLVGFTLLLAYGLDAYKYSYPNSGEGISTGTAMVLLTAGILFLLTLSYFKIKEKEV